MALPATPHREPALLHVCGRYLPLSETFTYALISRLSGFRHHVVAGTLENLGSFPLPSVHAPVPEHHAWPLARDLGIDGVVCHFGPQATMGMPVALMLGVPIVTVFHGYDISRLLRDRLWAERYRACFAAGMQALCISEAGRDRLLAIGCPDEQIAVIRLGVDTATFRFRPPSRRWRRHRPMRLLMVSRLVEKKGVHVALNAAARLHAEGVAFELRIIGDGPEHESLSAQITALGLSTTTLTGAATHHETREAFEWADIYLQPSVTASTGDEEGIPVALMEALASGIPAVSTRHSGIPELVVDGRTGLLTDEHDASALARAITTLGDAPALAEQLAVAGRHWVEQKFDQARQTAQTGEWLMQMVRSRTASPVLARGKPPRHGLVFQSIDTGLLARKLTLIAHKYPGYAFDVLATDAAALMLADLPCVRLVHPMAPALTCEAMSPQQRRALQDVRYDLALVPYSDETGENQANAMRLAADLQPGTVVGWTMRDRERRTPAGPTSLHAAPTVEIVPAAPA